MAKALLGHVGNGLDLRMANEMKRLRDRVRDLETEAIRLRAENTELRSSNTELRAAYTELSSLARVDEEMMRLTVAEPVRDIEPALT